MWNVEVFALHIKWTNHFLSAIYQFLCMPNDITNSINLQYRKRWLLHQIPLAVDFRLPNHFTNKILSTNKTILYWKMKCKEKTRYKIYFNKSHDRLSSCFCLLDWLPILFVINVIILATNLLCVLVCVCTKMKTFSRSLLFSQRNQIQFPMFYFTTIKKKRNSEKGKMFPSLR